MLKVGHGCNPNFLRAASAKPAHSDAVVPVVSTSSTSRMYRPRFFRMLNAKRSANVLRALAGESIQFEKLCSCADQEICSQLLAYHRRPFERGREINSA